jgi:hypothetical protein
MFSISGVIIYINIGQSDSNDVDFNITDSFLTFLSFKGPNAVKYCNFDINAFSRINVFSTSGNVSKMFNNDCLV